MSAVKWSAKTTKTDPVNADQLLIIDSAQVETNVKNKLVTIGSLPNIQSLNTDVSKAQFLKGGTGITVADASPDHTFAIDSTVVTFLGTGAFTNKTISDATNSISASVVKTGTLLDSVLSTNVMLLDQVQINTGAKQFQNTTVQFRNLGNTANYNLLTLGTSGDKNITLPLLLGNDTFVFEDHIQTLIGKTINASNNNLSNLIIGTQVTGTSINLTDTNTIAYLSTPNDYIVGNLQTFGPSSLGTAGLNVGSISGNPLTQSNGDMWYDSTENKLLAIINANVVDLSPSETLTWSEDHSATRFKLTNTGTIDFSILGGLVLPATTQPYVTYDIDLTPNALVLNTPTDDEIVLAFQRTTEYTFSKSIFDMKGNSLEGVSQIQDSSQNELLEFTGVTSAANHFEIKNAVTLAAPELKAAGSDLNIDIDLIPKGSGAVLIDGTPIVMSVTNQIDTKPTDQAIVATTETTITNLTLNLPTRTGGKAMISLFLSWILGANNQGITFKILDDTSTIIEKFFKVGSSGDLITQTLVVTAPLDGSVITVTVETDLGTLTINGGGTNSCFITSLEVG